MKGVRPKRILVHPGLAFGRQLTLARNGQPLACRRGDWDQSDAVCCVAMALALLGKLSDPRRVSTSSRRAEARFWDRAWPHYLHGLAFSELTSFIWELNLGVVPEAAEGPAGQLIRVCADELAHGRLALVAWRGRGETRMRVSLVVGVEEAGLRSTSTLLLLDPAYPESVFGLGNARLSAGVGGLTYLTPQGSVAVVLDGVVSIRSLSRS